MGKTSIQRKGTGDRWKTPSVDLVLAWPLADLVSDGGRRIQKQCKLLAT